MTDRLFPAHHRALQPRSIEGTIHRYAEWLERGLSDQLSKLGEVKGEVDLLKTVYEIIVRAQLNLTPTLYQSRY